jgi:hypothetical protein
MPPSMGIHGGGQQRGPVVPPVVVGGGGAAANKLNENRKPSIEIKTIFFIILTYANICPF